MIYIYIYYILLIRYYKLHVHVQYDSIFHYISLYYTMLYYAILYYAILYYAIITKKML